MGDTGRTPEQEFLDEHVDEIQDFNYPHYNIFLQQLFTFGTVPDKTFSLSNGLTVTLRLLAPREMLEVAKRVDECPGIFSKEITHKLEVLSRAISRINGQVLRFDDSMIAEWKELRKVNYSPTDVEQQRYIISYRFKVPVIESIFKKYQELILEQEEILKDLKKN